MDFPWFKLVVVLAFVERSLSLPLACSHNGTSYREGETVRTEEPCLSCTCQRGALECSLRVCADYPDVLSPGCFLVHKPNDCCPQLFCEETFDPAGVELRTGFKHENKLHGNDCVINGSIYAEGSALASSQVCEYCYCIEGEMKCVKPRCLQTFHGCKPIYEKSSCCPTHYDCRDADADFLAAQVKNFVSTNTFTVSSNSLRSLSNLDIKPEKENLTVTENVRTDLIEPTEKNEQTTTEESNTEETTIEPEKKSTAPVTEHLTTLGFQTTKTENPNKESTTFTFTEETTLAPETTTTTNLPRAENQEVHIRSKLTLFEGTENPVVSTDNSSQEADEYDSYDYSEPKLPPSLPNLVIFPFVAADAVVKDENVAAADEYDKVDIDRIDAHPVFYKDYFTSPIKTEGGFIPKEPPTSDEPFYDFNFFGKEQIEPPSLTENPAGSSQTVAPSSLTPNETNSSALVHRSPTTPTLLITSDGNPNPTPYPFGESITKTFSRNDSTAFPDILITKKPVTVTYKNFVLDFYPNYLITTTREHFKMQPLENSVSESAIDEDFYPSTPGEPLFGLAGISASPTEKATVKITSTTGKSSLFHEFIKSFLTDETTTTTIRPSTKRKYSSKIKNQVTTTFKPLVGDTHREGIEGFTGQLKESENDFSGTRDGSSTEETGDTKPNPGALLKLAGCNIYGMMYRVGKVITELSGPCLECLCTDLGVQCRPLKC